MHSLLNNYFVWVLAPFIETEDDNINNYYDFSQSIAEYTQTFKELNIEWKWQPISLHNYKTVIDEIANTKILKQKLILNLCDGDETNNTPGISIINYLTEKSLLFTGADAYFYNITTSKIPMKMAFDKCNVLSAKWQAIVNNTPLSANIFNELGCPIILKPAVSGGSMGVGINNVVKNIDELNNEVLHLMQGYRGWQLTADGIIAESFINGAEFTVMIVGNYDNPSNAIIYTPVERVFHTSLPDTEKFLSFERLWEIYENESPMPNQENFYEYRIPDVSLHNTIKNLAWNAYVACRGKSYTRVDIRMDKHTQQMYVLEVNAQCGLSEDENYTSIGAILRASNVSFTQLIQSILMNTIIENSGSLSITKKAAVA